MLYILFCTQIAIERESSDLGLSPHLNIDQDEVRALQSNNSTICDVMK